MESPNRASIGDFVDEDDDEISAEESERIAQIWVDVAVKRLEDLRAGRTVAIPYEVAMAQLRARLLACR